MVSQFQVGQKVSRHRLLIISCSQRKKLTAKLLPAIERYDGPLFQVLRKFQVNSSKTTDNLDVYILSAKFGLIPISKKIPFYDQPMSYQRAAQVNPKVIAKVKQVFADKRYREIFVCVGKQYLHALKGYDVFLPNSSVVTVASGSSGRRQAMLHKWLHGESRPDLAITPSGAAVIRGKKISLTPDEVIDIACRALAENKGEPRRYQSWYVPINGDRVAPKWLVSLLTNLPIGEFHSDEARRVLQQLGVKVVSL